MAKEVDRKYADLAMYQSEPIDKGATPKVYLLSATPDPLGACAAMSMMYEGKVCRNLADITDSERRYYWTESFKGHLKAPWESIDFHFMIENVTRAFTHQMVRQRTAVYAQESMRFAVKDNIAARPGPNVKAETTGQALKIWEQAMKDIWKAYNTLIDHGIPAEDARGLLPHDTLTRLHYKTNLRNLADQLGNRLCTQAQFEWRLVGAQLRDAIRKYDENYKNPDIKSQFGGDSWAGAAWQFEMIAESPIFQPVCFTMGRCPWKAGYDRGCTIRDRVDEGKFDDIKTEEWLADPSAAWVT